jgi:hypothetical protein
MSWLVQTTGIINHYNDKIHLGTQPIRVLHHVNVYWFQNLHPDFINELNDAFDKYGLSRTLDIKFGEHPIQFGPHITVADKTITFDETFLSYLWCISHSVYTLYIQTIDYPRLNLQYGYERYKVSDKLIKKAKALFDYGKSLIVDFTKWDIDNIPNPEKYLAEERDFIEQPNIFFTHAVDFILAHEYIHAIKHIDEIRKGVYDKSSFIAYEKEADYEAVELMKKGIHPSQINLLGIHIGITIGILSMLYFNSSTKGSKHPNIEDRLVDALNQLNLDENSPCWGIALIGIELWAEQFGLNYKWDKNLSDKQAFDKVIAEIKSTNA